MDFEQVILNFNKQLNFAELDAINMDALEGFDKPDGVIISGMGGSGLPATILQGLKHEVGLTAPILIWKNWGLPRHNFKNPFFIFISFSGNTEEVISGLEEAGKNKFPIAVITTRGGGKLKQMAEESDLPRILFNGEGLTPRQACGKMYYTLIKLLGVYFPKINAEDLSGKIDPASLREKGQKFAKELQGKIVLIYSAPKYRHLGYIWKIGINETSKQPAFTNELPEVDHNEVMGFTGKEFPFSALFLVDSENHSRFNDKIAALEDFLSKFNIPVHKITLSGKNAEEKTWNSVALSFWTSFYLAELSGVDPESTDVIEEIKKA